MNPFLYAFPGGPRRLKALQAETEKLVAELVTMRHYFASLRETTQDTLESLLDSFLTVHGFDDRLDQLRERRER